MPAAFTEEQRKEIRQKFHTAARQMVMDTPYQEIKVEELTQAAGISKGAFYKFYPTKEQLFYEILREMHEELFSSAMEAFADSREETPEEALCRTLLVCYDRVHTSPYRRFWMKDSREIMSAIPEQEKTEQQKAEQELFRKFLHHFGGTAVSEELAFAAIQTLIQTVYAREKLGPDYETILRWMAQGVCGHIFE